MNKSNFNLEKKLLKKGYEIIIGIDEAGRGPLAGPVVAAAVILKCHPELVSGSKEIPDPVPIGRQEVRNDKDLWMLIRDSKTLSEKQREKVFDFVQENFYVGIGICDHKTIDRINILEASFLAMKKAVSVLKHKIKSDTRFRLPGCAQRASGGRNDRGAIVLVDGNKKIPNFSMEQMAIVSGDKIVKSISAASIIAKVTRDRMMIEMHKKYPQYFFDKHKGYGTKLHMENLKKHGSCKIHRKSFSPVSKLVKKVF